MKVATSITLPWSAQYIINAIFTSWELRANTCHSLCVPRLPSPSSFSKQACCDQRLQQQAVQIYQYSRFHYSAQSLTSTSPISELSQLIPTILPYPCRRWTLSLPFGQ